MTHPLPHASSAVSADAARADTRALDTLSTLLAHQVHTRGAAVAVRYKARGLHHSQTFSELWRTLLAAQAVPTDKVHTLGLGWLVGALRASVDAATGARTEPLARAEADDRRVTTADLLWLEPTLEPHDVERSLSLWLQSGAVLVIGEATDTELVDRRELGPTVVLAASRWYDALTNDVLERTARASWLRRVLITWARETVSKRSSALLHALARLLVLRPLADQLGLSRTTHALVLGQVQPQTRSLFEALQVPVCSLDAAELESERSNAQHSRKDAGQLVDTVECSV